MPSQPLNKDDATIASFGDEWHRFDQKGMGVDESNRVFNDYFSIFPWDQLAPNAEGFDMGCGSGRWASHVAPRVGLLHCIDPSTALDVARNTLKEHSNITFHRASVSEQTLSVGSQDFGYSLGVLHHIPDTYSAICSCVALLKPGAPFLLYLYYNFDNRPYWFRSLWRLSNLFRLCICKLPPVYKQIATDLTALIVYWPLSRFSRVLESIGFSVHSFPLSYYRNCSFYTLRTDARDRFGTPLEQRFSRSEITEMCYAAGLVDLKFSTREPYWCVLGYKNS